MCFGVTAITLNRALEDARIKSNPNDQSEKGCLRTLIYMIRYAFAHNMIEPRWKVKRKYMKKIELNLNLIFCLQRHK